MFSMSQAIARICAIGFHSATSRLLRQFFAFTISHTTSYLNELFVKIDLKQVISVFQAPTFESEAESNVSNC